MPLFRVGLEMPYHDVLHLTGNDSVNTLWDAHTSARRLRNKSEPLGGQNCVVNTRDEA